MVETPQSYAIGATCVMRRLHTFQENANLLYFALVHHVYYFNDATYNQLIAIID
jgi:hypothetical protein